MNNYLRIVHTEAANSYILALQFKRSRNGTALVGAIRAGDVVWC